MKTAIVSVGTELLMGRVVNTNTVYLSQELNLLGFDVLYHHTAGDNPKRLKTLLIQALQECDLIITTGGLGPTQDDLTKEMVCQVMGDTLTFDEPSYQALKKAFQAFGKPMTENNVKQTYFPSRAVIFPNERGTAPGFALEKEGKYVICMPGPPKEMKAMFQGQAKPFLEKMSGGKLVYADVRTYGVGESELETKLLSLIDGQRDPTFATYALEGEAFLRVASKGDTREQAQKAVNEGVAKACEILGDSVYSTTGTSLAETVGQYLVEHKISLSAAESATGGLFASSLIALPGISEIFDSSLVTYSNQAKIRELGVRSDTLQTYGAVSRETAAEMAEGVSKKTGSDLCVSITGIAGPGGGSDTKPVGLAYIGISYKGKTSVYEMRTGKKNRESNRHRMTLRMLWLVWQVLRQKTVHQ